MSVKFEGKDSLMNQLNNLFGEKGNTTLKVGFFSDATYPSIKTGRTGLRSPKPGEADIQKKQTSQSVALVAAIHEFGAPASKIPARPFMRPTVDQLRNPSGKTRNEIANALEVRSTDAGIFDEKAASRLGEIVRGMIQDNILQDPLPDGAEKHEPLKDGTLAKRRYRRNINKYTGEIERIAYDAGEGHLRKAVDIAKPLVDTGFLLNSVTWEIEIDGENKRRKENHQDDEK